MADKYDLKKLLQSAADNVLWRPFVPSEQKRLLKSLIKLFDINDPALDALVSVYNAMEGETMALEYLKDCPDCLPLLTTFPVSCVQVVLNALRGQVDDVKCVIHCAETVQWWAVGLYVGSEEPVTTGAGSQPDAKEAAAVELEKLLVKGAKADLTAVNWKLILGVILDFLRQLLG